MGGIGIRLARARAKRDRENGAAAVEFALVLPIFLAVLFGMIDYSWYYYQRFALAAAVRDGVRNGVTVALISDPWTTAKTQVIADMNMSGSALSVGNVITWGPTVGKIGGSFPNQYLNFSVTMSYTPLVGFIPFLPTQMSYQMSMFLEVQ
jgi:Flp pilus assembly protein TadG